MTTEQKIIYHPYPYGGEREYFLRIEDLEEHVGDYFKKFVIDEEQGIARQVNTENKFEHIFVFNNEGYVTDEIVVAPHYVFTREIKYAKDNKLIGILDNDDYRETIAKISDTEKIVAVKTPLTSEYFYKVLEGERYSSKKITETKFKAVFKEAFGLTFLN